MARHKIKRGEKNPECLRNNLISLLSCCTGLIFWDRWASVLHEMTFEVNNLIKSEYLLTLDSVCFLIKLYPKGLEVNIYLRRGKETTWENDIILDYNFFGFTVTTSCLYQWRWTRCLPSSLSWIGIQHRSITNHYSWKAALISQQM